MPRLLPILIKNIRAVRHHQVLKRDKQVKKDVKNIVSQALPPNLSPYGRKQSILLDEVNPIIHSDTFVHHKRDAPHISMVSRPTQVNDEVQMTEHERELWSNPYLRMLSSPSRLCLLTEQYLPSDFMIRLAALKVHDSRISQAITALLPDGLEHSRCKTRKSGRGWYVLCNKQAIAELQNRGTYKRIPSPTPLQLHAFLAEQIRQQLRMRILQELEHLVNCLRAAPRHSLKHKVVRRLTRREWKEIKTNGLIPLPGALAILVVPAAKEQEQSDESETVEDEDTPALSIPSPPLCVMYPTEPGSNIVSPAKRVPLYNVITLFPCQVMRSKFLDVLQKAEIQACRPKKLTINWKESKSEDQDTPDYLDKTSHHAYLICAEGDTVHRADTVPLAIALWRIRLWEGQGWEATLGNYGGWTDE